MKGEELLKKSEKEEQKNINEGNLDINDPVEVQPISEIDLNSSEELATPDESQAEESIKEATQIEEIKKPEPRFRFKRYKIQEVIKPNQVI